MTETMTWRDGVKIVRAASLDALMRGPSGIGRATAFDFAGTGSQQTWIGRATGAVPRQEVVAPARQHDVGHLHKEAP